MASTELRVLLEDKPGAVAAAAEALAKAGVNIASLAGMPTGGGRGDIRIVVADAAKARSALEGAGQKIDRERELLVVDLADKPGELARTARSLANAGINLDAVYLVGQSGTTKSVAFGVPDVAKAKAALGT